MQNKQDITDLSFLSVSLRETPSVQLRVTKLLNTAFHGVEFTERHGVKTVISFLFHVTKKSV